MTIKKILLEAWAKANYDPPPSAWVLRRWARDGELHPQPVKVGRSYYVQANARHVSDIAATPKLSLVDRIKAASHA